MIEPLVFRDLSRLDREPTSEEQRWLTLLARDTDPRNFTVSLGRAIAASDPQPIVQQDADGRWRAGRYVGELYRDGRTIEILPRLGIGTIAAWAGTALNVHIVPRSAEHTKAATLIAELLAATWRSALADAARHGPPGLRETRHQVSEHAKGRLDIHRTLVLRSARRAHLASISKPKNVDNPVTRAIVLADRILDRRIQRRGWRGERVEEIIPHLRAAVGNRPAMPTRQELDNIRYTPITLPYKRVADLSWRIARHRGLRSRATAEKADGMLIDVAELWELFLLHCAKRAFGASEVTHGTRLRETRPLLYSLSKPTATLGRLYPDLVIGAVEKPRAIIDAKYKPLSDPRGVDRDDLYQLNAYLAVHTASPLPHGTLAYVRFPEQRAISSAELNGPWQTAQGHRVHFERLPITEPECIEALRRLAPNP